ncbi:MAG: bifunctional riboflavin kinase/FAD synthetase [Gemmatimonadota bacterium]
MSEAAIDLTIPKGLPSDGRGTVATVGTFDGLHRGHWAVLLEIQERARRTGRRAVLLTFHPHPLRIVRPEVAPKLLTTPVEKKEILAESGLDYAVFLNFTAALSRYSPRRFVEEMLVDRLGVEELVIGYDHGFGRGRSGDVDTLREIGSELGFDVGVVGPVAMDGGAVSSSRIREAVSQGQMGVAHQGLGRPYSLRGFVVRGDGRGRTLGFPTANLEIGSTEKLLPPPGIYAVRAALRDGIHSGALHIGPRPTFQGSPPSIELHVIDFDQDVYGEEVRVDLVQFLRPIESFESATALVEQMKKDVVRTREVLALDARSEPNPHG